jgi:hypothetical protein
VVLSATLKMKSFDGEVAHYVDTFGGRHAFLAEAIAVRASDLPHPPPALLRVSLDWYQTPRSRPAEKVENGGQMRAAAAPTLGPGDMVKVVKSRISGVESPAERLEQHLGKIGMVRWVTAGGANVDLSGEVVWFAYEELELVG